LRCTARRVHPLRKLADLGRSVSSRPLDGGDDALFSLDLEPVELVFGDAGIDEQGAYPPQRIVFGVLRDLLAGAVAEARIGDRMATEAVGDELQHGRSAILAGRGGERAGGFDHGRQVVAVDPLGPHAVGAGALVQIGDRRGALDAGPHAVLVVHDEEDDG
jgi:hypothetical protein